jgi:hypothetical protein
VREATINACRADRAHATACTSQKQQAVSLGIHYKYPVTVTVTVTLWSGKKVQFGVWSKLFSNGVKSTVYTEQKWLNNTWKSRFIFLLAVLWFLIFCSLNKSISLKYLIEFMPSVQAGLSPASHKLRESCQPSRRKGQVAHACSIEQ